MSHKRQHLVCSSTESLEQSLRFSFLLLVHLDVSLSRSYDDCSIANYEDIFLKLIHHSAVGIIVLSSTHLRECLRAFEAVSSVHPAVRQAAKL